MPCLGSDDNKFFNEDEMSFLILNDKNLWTKEDMDLRHG